jgi:isoquinoline 1-oxidoreductase alpha subunit
MTSFTVNGQPVHYKMDPETPLLWALRDASNLTGTKYGCGAGLCGACTVHIDGQAVRSCQVSIASIEGSFVTKGFPAIAAIPCSRRGWKRICRNAAIASRA